MKNLIYLLLFIGNLSAQNNIDYSSASIPDSLLKDAVAVVRYESNKYDYLSNENVVYKYHVVKTILKAEGIKLASQIWHYDQHLKINDIEGNLYNAQGKKIKSLKNKDIKDFAAYDGFSIGSDNRIKEIDFNYGDYPYTVEYIIESTNLTTHHSLKDELPYSTKVSMQYFETIYNFPLDVNYNTYLYNIDDEVFKTQDTIKNRKIITYKCSPKTSIKTEELSKPNAKLKVIFTQFSDIKYDDYQGSIASWKDYGNFILQLNAGRDLLPEAEKAKVHEITSNLSSDKEKVKALYKYMQSKTRYISIQYGIGGHQPFPASDVARLGYGDCKALSNYMYALLKEAGIKSNYVLIFAGEDEFNIPYEKYTLPYFNHAILMVPQEKDSLWLECTSQTQFCGYQGSFTGNRQALIIDKDNSQIVSTKRYDATKNYTHNTATLSIDENGTCDVICNSTFSCMNADNLRIMMDNYGKEELEKYLNSSYQLSYTINDYKHEKIDSEYPKINQYLKLQLPYYASKTGKRIFILPNLFSKIETKYQIDSTRKNDLYLPRSYAVSDTIIIKIPEAYKIESCPKDMHISNEFGKYDATYERAEGQIKFIRTRIVVQGTFDKSKYNDYVKYNDLIYSGDRGKIVLVTK